MAKSLPGCPQFPPTYSRYSLDVLNIRTFPSFIWFHPYFLLPWPHPSVQARPSDPDVRCKNTDQLTQSVQLRSFYHQLSHVHTSTESSIHERILSYSHVILGCPRCGTRISSSWVKPEHRQQHVRCGYGSQRLRCTQNVFFSEKNRGRCFLSPHTGIQRVRRNTLHLKRFSGLDFQKSCPENKNGFVRGARQRAEDFYEHQSREKDWQGNCVLTEAYASTFLHWKQED